MNNNSNIGLEITYGELVIIPNVYITAENHIDDKQKIDNYFSKAIRLSTKAYPDIGDQITNSKEIILGMKTRAIFFEESNFGGRSYVFDNNSETYKYVKTADLLARCDFDKISSLIIPETYDYFIMKPFVGYDNNPDMGIEGFGMQNSSSNMNWFNILLVVGIIALVYYLFMRKKIE